MLLATDINDCIFSYLFAEELCNCFATCKLWNASKDSKSTSVLIWFNLYRHLVEFPKLAPHAHNFSWHQKVKELYSFVSGTNPFTLTDGRSESQKLIKVPRVTLTSIQPIRLVCRSGHTASLFYVDKREVIVFFGGATHFYTFVNSYDILSVDNGVPLRTYATVKGDVPTARWLHRACSYEAHTKVIVFGGQINDGAFSNEVFQFTLVESGAREAQGGYSSSLSLESVLVPPIDGDNQNGPLPRGGHSFVYDKTNNRFIVFGGLTSGNEVEVCVNDTYQLVIENDALFTLNEAVSPGRLGYDCRKIGRSNSGYGEGSSQGGSSSSSGPMAVWKKLHCTGTLPSPRWCHSGVLHGEDMIVFGGWSYERTVGVGTGSKFFNDVHMLNITTLVWTKVETTGSPPRARCQCACFLFQNKIDDLADKGSEEEKDDINYKTNTESRHLSDSDLKRHTKGTSGEMEYSSSSLSAHSKEGKSASTPLSIEIGSIAAKLTSNTSSPLELILNPAEEFKKKNVKCVKVSGTLLDGSFDSKDGDIDINQLSLSHYSSAMATNSDSDSHIRGAKVFSSEKMSSATCDRGSESSLLGTLDLVLSGSARETNEEIGSLDGGHEVIGKTDTQGEGQQEQEEQENSSMRVHCGNESVAISPATGKSYRSEGEGSGTVDRVMESGSDEPPGRGVIRVPPVESNQDSSISSNSNSNSNSISSSSKTSEVEMVMETETEAETETETEQPVASKGYMIIFGGSCHNQEVESANVAYGSLVVDFHDFKVLDLDTLVWLPVSCSYPRCRGGIHAIVETNRGWLLSGGMQTEGISDMPRFKNDTTFIIPNIGCEVYASPTWRSSRKIPNESDDDLRVKNKFLFVKA